MFEPPQLMTELAKQELEAAPTVSCHCSPTATTAKAHERRSARRLLRSRPSCHVRAINLPLHLATARTACGGAPVTQTLLAHDELGVCLARIDREWAAAGGGVRLRA
jgi:hypothetical protein